MKSMVRLRLVLASIALVTLAGVLSLHYWTSTDRASSFSVYYTAAYLVRSNMNVHLYDGIQKGVNPQLVVADPTTVFARTAGAHGIPRVMLYLYPPTFADLFVPLTFFSPIVAFSVWDTLNLVMLLVASVILTRMLKFGSLGSASLVAVFLVLFRPTLSCLYFGQASILLLLLLVAGANYYAHGRKNIAGLMFALAIAIKLTPLIVIVPFIAWRDWKIVRSIALWGLAILGALWIVNGSATIDLYFRHVLPSMSNENLGSEMYIYSNRTLGSIFYACVRAFHHGSTLTVLVRTVKIVSMIVISYAGWLSRMKKEDERLDDQWLAIFAIFLLLSCCITPFSWLYAWVLSAPSLVIFGKRISERRSSAAETALFMLVLISLSTSKFHFGLATSPLGIALGIIGLHRIRVERHTEEVSARAIIDYLPQPS